MWVDDPRGVVGSSPDRARITFPTLSSPSLSFHASGVGDGAPLVTDGSPGGAQ